jgi:UDPglucose 6-dehydrogenase
VIAYDPMAMEKSKVLFEGKIKYASSAVECIDGADCCIIVTEWPEFKTLRWEDFINHMKRPILIDGRRIYDAEEFDRRLKYAAIGLGRRPG